MLNTSKYRMNDLVRATDFPASSIRYYLKQGLLPEPERPTPNSALYSESHLEALRTIKQLKRMAPELPIAQLRRVMELVEQGVECEVALSLHRSVANGTNEIAAGRFDAEALGDPKFVAKLVDAGILVVAPGNEAQPFDQADLLVVEMLQGFEQMVPGGLARVTEIAALLREASAIEMELRNRASNGATPAVAAAISGQMQEWANFWHSYLFARLRLNEIAEQGVGHTRPE